MKHCSLCDKLKHESEFYTDRRRPCGLKSQCRECHIAGSIRTRDPDNHRVIGMLHMRRARASDIEKFRARERAAERRYPERVLARQITNSAIKSGRLVKPFLCSACGKSGRITAHHDDYSRHLDVVWLCYSCHGKLHRVENRAAPSHLPAMQPAGNGVKPGTENT